jgi:ABC-2 type transport system permease protein
MIGALRYEWTRLLTLRSTWWISAGSIIVGVGFTFFLSMILALNAPTELRGDVDEEWSRFYLDAAMTQFSNVDPMFYLLAYVIAILGILAWGHEYRHGMIRATLAAVPQRWTIFTAKFVVIGAWVAVVVLISCLLSLLCSLIWFTGLDFQYDWGYLFLAIFKRIVYAVLLTWLVMSVTVLIRHQTFALVLLYLWPLGIETMIRLVLLPLSALTGDDDLYELSRFLPFNAGSRIIQTFGTVPDGADGFGFQDNLDLFGEPLSALGGFIVFGGLTFAMMAAAYASFEKRDA